MLRGADYLSSLDSDPSYILSTSNAAVLSRRLRQDAILETVMERWGGEVDEGVVRDSLNEEVFEVIMELGGGGDDREENEERMRGLETELHDIYSQESFLSGTETKVEVLELVKRVNEGRYWDRVEKQIDVNDGHVSQG